MQLVLHQTENRKLNFEKLLKGMLKESSLFKTVTYPTAIIAQLGNGKMPMQPIQ
jgi:hypothetical protein